MKVRLDMTNSSFCFPLLLSNAATGMVAGLLDLGELQFAQDFPGCSTESPMSQETLQYWANQDVWSPRVLPEHSHGELQLDSPHSDQV